MNPSAPPITVLLIEDSQDYAALVVKWLSSQAASAEFTVVWTDSLTASLSRLEQGGIDFILVDLGLPDSDGLATFTALRGRAADLPMIVLSGAESEALAVQTVQLGAQDYLVKSTCTAELLTRTLRHARVRHQLGVNRPRLENSTAQARIVGVLSAAGGAGATIVACVLAAELRHHTDQTTLLMDLDSNPGLLSFTLGIDPEFCLQDAVERADQLDSAIWEELITRRPGDLDILASSKTATDGIDIARLNTVVRFAAARYHWIVMDLGRLNQGSVQLLENAQDVLLVSTESLPALHQCKRTISMLLDLGIAEERLRLILNQKDAGEMVARKELENIFGVTIAATLPPAHKDLDESYRKKRLPSVTGAFRSVLREFARKLAGLPEEAQNLSPLSLTNLRARFFHKKGTRAIAS